MVVQSGESTWSEEELSPLFSAYLRDDYRSEVLRLKSVHRTEDRFTAECSVAGGAIDTLGRFHLSAVSAMVIASQLAVVAAHIDQGILVKTGEVFVRDLSLRFRRQVVDAEFTCDLQVSKRREVSNGVYYKLLLSIDSDSFLGDASVLHMRGPSLNG